MVYIVHVVQMDVGGRVHRQTLQPPQSTGHPEPSYSVLPLQVYQGCGWPLHPSYSSAYRSSIQVGHRWCCIDDPGGAGWRGGVKYPEKMGGLGCSDCGGRTKCEMDGDFTGRYTCGAYASYSDLQLPCQISRKEGRIREKFSSCFSWRPQNHFNPRVSRPTEPLRPTQVGLFQLEAPQNPFLRRRVGW